MTIAAETAPVTTMASAMLFGTITFTTVALYARCKLGGSYNRNESSLISGDALLEAASNPRSSAVDVNSITSIFTLLYHSTIMGLILFYAYICEYHPPFPHAPKTYDRDEFFFYTALLFVASFFTIKSVIKKNPPSSKEQSIDVANGKENGGDDVQRERAIAPVDDRTEILNRYQTRRNSHYRCKCVSTLRQGKTSDE